MLILKLYVAHLHKTCHNSEMLRSILIIFKELLNINKANIKVWMGN